jgi:1-acyl-sn-glycerol-3-phosphate acyltransferase
VSRRHSRSERPAVPTRHWLGVVTFVSLVVCISTWFAIMTPLVILRTVPVYRVQRFFARANVKFATFWVGSNQLLYRVLHPRIRQIEVEGTLDRKKSYMVLSNHQSWADILMLFNVLHKRLPFLRFFLKQELIWVPIVGVICWAMDFPFMRRYSAEKLARNPQLASKDLETTRKACEIYKLDPVAVVNFAEGTRFSPRKAKRSKSPYRHLLKPKYAGLSAAFNAMGEQFEGIVDVTVDYEPHNGSIAWSWLCGGQSGARVHIRVIPVPQHLIAGNYREDPKFRQQFKEWLDGVWAEKDARLERLRSGVVQPAVLEPAEQAA